MHSSIMFKSAIALFFVMFAIIGKIGIDKLSEKKAVEYEEYAFIHIDKILEESAPAAGEEIEIYETEIDESALEVTQ